MINNRPLHTFYYLNRFISMEAKYFHLGQYIVFTLSKGGFVFPPQKGMVIYFCWFRILKLYFVKFGWHDIFCNTTHFSPTFTPCLLNGQLLNITWMDTTYLATYHVHGSIVLCLGHCTFKFSPPLDQTSGA